MIVLFWLTVDIWRVKICSIWVCERCCSTSSTVRQFGLTFRIHKLAVDQSFQILVWKKVSEEEVEEEEEERAQIGSDATSLELDKSENEEGLEGDNIEQGKITESISVARLGPPGPRHGYLLRTWAFPKTYLADSGIFTWNIYDKLAHNSRPKYEFISPKFLSFPLICQLLKRTIWINQSQSVNDNQIILHHRTNFCCKADQLCLVFFMK